MDLLHVKKTVFMLLLSAICLRASDTEANTFFAQARDREKAGSFRKAASAYMDAHFMADSPVLRGNSLIAAARAYRKAKLYGSEFDCLQKLLREHLNGIDFTLVTERIYTIGDLFFAGHRDLFADWLPFIKKEDRTLEIYEAALQAAPCLERSTEVRLRLARLYIDDQKVRKAIGHLRQISKTDSSRPAGKFALLELCSLLSQMSERGDGDNSYSKQAIEACDEYSRLYGSTPENQWVRKTRQQVRSRIAARLYSTGSYYHKSGKDALAERYLANVIKEYADTESAGPAEKILAEINTASGGISPVRVPLRKEEEKFRILPIPGEDQPIMVTPEQSNGKWLLPVRDLRRSTVLDSESVLQKDTYLRFPAGKSSRSKAEEGSKK